MPSRGGRVSGPDQGFVLRQVASRPVKLVLDLPVAADPGGHGSRVGVAVVGDEVDDLDGLLSLLRDCAPQLRASRAAPANPIQAGA